MRACIGLHSTSPITTRWPKAPAREATRRRRLRLLADCAGVRGRAAAIVDQLRGTLGHSLLPILQARHGLDDAIRSRWNHGRTDKGRFEGTGGAGGAVPAPPTLSAMPASPTDGETLPSKYEVANVGQQRHAALNSVFLQRISCEVWRRDRDSNPGWSHPHNGFRDRPDRPLRHLSIAQSFRQSGTEPQHRNRAANGEALGIQLWASRNRPGIVAPERGRGGPRSGGADERQGHRNAGRTGPPRRA